MARRNAALAEVMPPALEAAIEKTVVTGCGAYGNIAPEVSIWGLGAFPATNKKPHLSGWTKHKNRPSASTINKHKSKWPRADWGHQPAVCNMVVVDWDSEDLAEALRLFGPCRFIVKTRRGYHLYYYLKGGCRSYDLSGHHIPCQIKSRSGFVMGWGSQTSDGATLYRIYKGSILDLHNLTPFNVGALESITGKWLSEKGQLSTSAKMRDGKRRALFKYMRRLGASGHLNPDDPAEAIAMANAFAAEYFDEEMPQSRIVETVMLVLTYVRNGTCQMPGRERNMAVPTKQELQQIRKLNPKQFDQADASYLLMHLRGAHGLRCAQGETFAIVASAMSKAQVIAAWGHGRYLKSTAALLSAGLLTRVSKATTEVITDKSGKKARLNHPAEYQFTKLVEAKRKAA